MSGRVGVEQAPDIAAVLREAIVAGLRKCRHEEAPIPLAQEGNEHHVAFMVLREVAPVLAAAVRGARAAAWDEGFNSDYEGDGWPPNPHRADRIAVHAPDIPCPTCGPTTHEQHPRRAEVQRCSNCKEWLVVDGAICDYGFPDAPEGGEGR